MSGWVDVPAEAAGMTFEDSIVIDAAAAALFELSQDYNRRLEWDPFLRSANCSDGAGRAGRRRACPVRGPKRHGDGNRVRFV